MPTVSQAPSFEPAQVNPIVTIPPLFPVYSPFQAQHNLLVHLQKLLELVCYNFGKKLMPDIMLQRGWNCPELVELNRWTEEFTKSKQ